MSLDFPPADQCSPEDLDAIADLVVSDPRASWDLAGSRAHIEALCRRYQALAQDRSDLMERDQRHEQARERLGQLASEALDKKQAAVKTAAAMERALAAATNDLDRVKEERDARQQALAARSLRNNALVAELDAARTEIRALEASLSTGTADLDEARRDLDAARRAIADREDEIARVNNDRQAEALAAEADRERADTAETAAELFETIARCMWKILERRVQADRPSLEEVVHAVDGRLARALVRERQIGAAFSAKLEDALRKLEGHQETHEANDQIRSAFASAVPASTGVTVVELDAQLDAELAAHPDVGPLHHARDQRDHQEDTTP